MARHWLVINQAMHASACIPDSVGAVLFCIPRLCLSAKQLHNSVALGSTSCAAALGAWLWLQCYNRILKGQHCNTGAAGRPPDSHRMPPPSQAPKPKPAAPRRAGDSALKPCQRPRASGPAVEPPTGLAGNPADAQGPAAGLVAALASEDGAPCPNPAPCPAPAAMQVAPAAAGADDAGASGVPCARTTLEAAIRRAVYQFSHT